MKIIILTLSNGVYVQRRTLYSIVYHIFWNESVIQYNVINVDKVELLLVDFKVIIITNLLASSNIISKTTDNQNISQSTNE